MQGNEVLSHKAESIV